MMRHFLKYTVVLLCAMVSMVAAFAFRGQRQPAPPYIRINLLGYLPDGPKTAVWCNSTDQILASFYITDVTTGKVMFKGNTGPAYGAYGPFAQSYRLIFSQFRTPGRYTLRAGEAISPEFTIGNDVYKGAADFCLRYMRQQRSGFNPFLKDSCHTHDGYTMYGPMPDSTHVDVSGGWHDASDYLQYATTSANATWHLLAAYRDFPQVFGDEHQANGLSGSNKRADVLDEAKWGLDWLLKMHPAQTGCSTNWAMTATMQVCASQKKILFTARGLSGRCISVQGSHRACSNTRTALRGSLLPPVNLQVRLHWAIK
jgi:endoglucanase